MPKQVIVTTIWSCSLCELDTDAEKIAPYEIHVGAKVLAYDICATCAASGPFADILSKGLSERAAGTKKVSALDSEGRVKCQYCEKSFTEQGMGLHQAKAHNVRSANKAMVEARGKAGKFVCGCGFRATAAQGLAAHRRSNGHQPAEVEKAVTGHPCPDCPDFTATNAQGLGAHRRHFHPGEPKLGHGGGHKSRAK